ncbi:MAG: LL-diaminopimelate aminotransferase [Lentisphaerae bacterium]|jgi:LL-diaminopimelate aminotransferase|nr:LL-diaminopimelate aminotransferase [Lentisphaerota bacterium]
MIRINEHYDKLQASYLFSDIARRVKAYQDAHPDQKVIRLGIGDVTEPLPAACIEALHKAVDEMATSSTFRGYGPEQGYDFLRQTIAINDFQQRGAPVEADEIFVSDGAKCDTANIQELFSTDIRVAIPDPVYPVYVDTNVMAGRTGVAVNSRYQGLVYLPSNEENGFVPDLPTEPVDLVYLCFPNNPTGATATREQLTRWVNYALENKTLILYDAAYEAFIRDSSLPHSIYEIPGARDCAIEFRSFSKTAGFTGTRCAFTVVPKSLNGYNSQGNPVPLHPMWNRRHTTKFNGVSYPIQRAAEAVYSTEGQAQTKALIDFYLENAAIIRQTLTELGYAVTGGINAPYVWVKTGQADSWKFFDTLLDRAQVVTTPGSGFGHCGQGYIRISAFNSRGQVEEAMTRIKKVI